VFIEIIHDRIPIIQNDFLLRLGKPDVAFVPQFLQGGFGIGVAPQFARGRFVLQKV